MKRFSGSVPISIVALVLAVGGSADAAGVIDIRIGTANIKNNAVTASKLSPALRDELAALGHTTGAPGPRGPAGPQGPTGPQGPAGSSSLYESSTLCLDNLCMEGSPGPSNDGNTGGWTIGGQPTTRVSVGSTASLNVVVVQANLGGVMGESGAGEVTLTYDPYDFQYVGQSDPFATCTAVHDSLTGALAGVESCRAATLNNDIYTDAFEFKALHADPDAVVNATEQLYGNDPMGVPYQQTSGSFPVDLS